MLPKPTAAGIVERKIGVSPSGLSFQLTIFTYTDQSWTMLGEMFYRGMPTSVPFRFPVPEHIARTIFQGFNQPLRPYLDLTAPPESE